PSLRRQLGLHELLAKKEIMNPFQDALSQICAKVDGAVVATIMGVDGLPVDSFEAAKSDDMDVASLLVEYSALIPQVKKSVAMFEAGNLEELAIRSERLTTIIRPVTSEYFVALAVRTVGTNFGRSRYVLRVHAPKLALELS